MLRKQHKVDEYHNDMPLIYYVEGHSLHFGRPEFALITGMRFGTIRFCSYTSADLKFRNRVFPYKVGFVVTNLDILGVIEDEVMFGNLCDEDSVRLCLILALEVIFMGRLLTCPVDDSLFELVENLEAWNVFLWGEHVWTQLYDSIQNVVVKHSDTHYLGLKKDRNYVPTYTLTGFVFAFQIWILESFERSNRWWINAPQVIPRAIGWSKKSIFKRSDCCYLFAKDSKTNTDIRPTRAEYQSSWWIESNVLALERNDKLGFNKDLSRLRGDFVESLNILFQGLVDPHDSVEDIANEYLVDEELKLCLEEEERIRSELEKRIQQEKRLRLEEDKMLRLVEEKMLQITEDVSRLFHSMDTIWLSDDIERFISQPEQLKSMFTWSNDYTVSRNFWLRLVCLDPCRKDLWVDYMWHGRCENANWAIVSCYFVQLLMQNNMPLFYANGDKYGIPWSDVDQLEYEHVVYESDFTGMRLQHRFPAQSVGSSNTDVLDSPCLLVLITGTSQSRQHGKSESDSYYLSDLVVNSFTGPKLISSYHKLGSYGILQVTYQELV
ncbi:phospholipase-like protein [Tanacetum coccineum]